METDIQEIVRMLVARMSAKIFLGQPACRDPEWLRVSLDFTMDVFKTAFVLRMFPTWMRFIVALFLPARYKLRGYREKAKQVVGAKIARHSNAVRMKEMGKPVEEEDTLVDWMLENGNPEETSVPEMANRQLAMTLASIHTTSTNTANFLFELCAHPEWFPVLREEIDEVSKQVGNGSEVDIRLWHPRLERMDSFLLECFRVHPPILR